MAAAADVERFPSHGIHNLLNYMANAGAIIDPKEQVLDADALMKVKL